MVERSPKMAGDSDGGGDTTQVILPKLYRRQQQLSNRVEPLGPSISATVGKFGGGGDTTALPHQNKTSPLYQLDVARALRFNRTPLAQFGYASRRLLRPSRK